jgi:serine protease
VHGVNTAELSWIGATSPNVDVYRNGGVIATTTNNGAYTDSTGSRGHATYTYKVCEAGSVNCSNQVTVTF